MKVPFDDIDTAFEWVSGAPEMANYAYLCRETGRIYFVSDLMDSDEDCPEDVDENDQYVLIPHKKELGCGTNLVWSFVREHAPDLAEEVEEIFSRKGAYSRFKSLLSAHGKLDNWFRYEAAEKNAALRAWCEDSGIELQD